MRPQDPGQYGHRLDHQTQRTLTQSLGFFLAVGKDPHVA
jgi:hypothetical protein